ncbi:hypothetical protein B9Q11_00575 [Candidatus Marsarchaeota G2 archaeon ECH_B_SAG-F08]|uniref:ABC-2 type transporter domain-containing protein n=2 Tax=Candidatus Marsarchaeota group 2 TaxID=2203771 RepID=A0A2R6BME3_9ARCH|nr:MAG: hypothetical protein B9Q11_00575 [Candidatus Marsarchaeota G2 archaeon ECH_B_SAG-F08]PSO04353.1 MAG: hypothetical protein B9Q13_04810 [Candidatus Marsarchaeota G2 archaeon ECH_B_SAG-G16]
MLFTRFARSLLKNRPLWGWGVLFMVFYLLLGAFVFSSSLPKLPNQAIVGYTSSWYAVINLYTLASLAISLSFSLIFSTHSLAYSFRFTRLTPKKYFANFVLSSAIVGLVLSVLIVAATYTLFSYRFQINIPPAKPLLVIAVAAFSSVLMCAFATLLVLVLINYLGLKNQSFVSFIPLILGFGFGFSQLFTSLPKALLYASPYSAIVGLLYSGYSGFPVLIILTNPSSATLDSYYLALSLVTWTFALLLIDAYLLGRIKPRSVEEMRQL